MKTSARTGSSGWNDALLGRVVAHQLRIGVVTAAIVVALGGLIFLFRHGTEEAQYEVFRGQRSSFRSLTGILTEASSFSGRGIILVGILVLIATPVLRVATCLWAFIRQRDWTYVVICLIVLGFLLFSLVIGPL